MAIGSTLHKPLFRFGVCTDLQWADIDDGYSMGGALRCATLSLVCCFARSDSVMHMTEVRTQVGVKCVKVRHIPSAQLR